MDGFPCVSCGAGDLARFDKAHVAEPEVLPGEDGCGVKEVARAIVAFEKAKSEPAVEKPRVGREVKPSPVVAGALEGGECGKAFGPIFRPAGEALERVTENLPQRFHDISRDAPRHLGLE